MQDRFKFRVYVDENDEYPESTGYVDTEDFYVHPDGDIGFFNADYDFVEYIIEQCTGLKDKNGKLIYENDLLKDYNGIWQVKWNNEEGAFYIWNKKRDFYLSPFIGEYEIVGNINEDPELLEEKEE